MSTARSQPIDAPRRPPAHQPRHLVADTPPNTSATLTVEEAAEILGVGRRTAYKAVAAGELPALRLGNRLVVPRAKLNAMLGIAQSDAEVGG
jgi:excisionase family DNA binding protein